MIDQLYNAWVVLKGADVMPSHVHEMHFQEQSLIVDFQIVIKVPYFDLKTLTPEQRDAISGTISPAAQGSTDAFHWFIFRGDFSARINEMTPELARERYRQFAHDTKKKMADWASFVPWATAAKEGETA